MKVEILNHSGNRVISPIFIGSWLKKVVKELKLRKIQVTKLNQTLVIAFIKESHIKKLNQIYRKKNKATDVLSFSTGDLSFEKKQGSIYSMKKLKQKKKIIGELVLCPRYIRRQALKLKISARQQTAYIILHGLLHLLGYDHETTPKEAQKMYHLQDDIFLSYFK